MQTTIDQALTRAFDSMSAVRAALSAHRSEMSRETFTELWGHTSAARMAVSTAREELEARDG